MEKHTIEAGSLDVLDGPYGWPGPHFQYVNRLDAVGTLYQEAAVSYIDSLRDGKDEEAERWRKAVEGIRAGWPDLASASVGRAPAPLE